MTEGVTADVVREMAPRGISCHDFFTLSMQELHAAFDRSFRCDDNLRQEALFRARSEVQFVTSHNIRCLFLTDDDYPVLLRETPDAPVLLYVLGRANLNAQPVFNIVGTRRCTSYGTGFCRSFVSGMAPYFPEAIVVSGLAFGIDAAAHTAALDNNLTTVAVVAHGLDRIYPAQHRDLARRIIAAGGAIVTEYPSGVRPFQRNFLERNRIVAGMSELTVVAESDVRGGALSTANQAFNYSREVIAVPGRFSDQASAGCNNLIARNKAHIYTSVAETITLMGWKIPVLGRTPAISEKVLFPELSDEGSAVCSFLRRKAAPASLDEIHAATALPMPLLMSTVTELEFDGILVKLPGARYELC